MTARRRPTATEVAAVAAGGAIGAPLRYAAHRWAPVAAVEVPWTTFAINVVGAFLLGAALAALAGRCRSWPLQAFLCTGLLGSLTTFSAVSLEVMSLVAAGRAAVAAGYVLATGAAGLLAVVAGSVLVRR